MDKESLLTAVRIVRRHFPATLYHQEDFDEVIWEIAKALAFRNATIAGPHLLLHSGSLKIGAAVVLQQYGKEGEQGLYMLKGND